MLRIKFFVFSPFSENTYLLINDQKECAIVDPGCYEQSEKEQLKNYIEKNELEVKMLLNTHSHLDHIFGNAFVSRTWNVSPQVHPLDEPVYSRFERTCVTYGIPGAETPSDPEYSLEEGKSVWLGDEEFEVMFLPGHCPGHVAFIHHKTKTIISGDVLFERSIGRTDLPGGDHETLIRSIKEKLILLPEDYVVHSGHGRPTTIGAEIKHNPFLK